MLRLQRRLPGYVSSQPQGDCPDEESGESVRREQGAKGMGTQLTLFHVEHIHCPEELGLPVQTALAQAS